MNEQTAWRLATIAAAVIVIIALGASIVTMFEHKETKHQKAIQAQEVANRHIIDSLVLDHRDDMVRLQVYTEQVLTQRDSLIQVINTRIDKIKISYDQKVGNVSLLPDDSLLRLLSGDVSR